jgi:hypothetical protein
MGHVIAESRDLFWADLGGTRAEAAIPRLDAVRDDHLCGVQRGSLLMGIAGPGVSPHIVEKTLATGSSEQT